MISIFERQDILHGTQQLQRNQNFSLFTEVSVKHDKENCPQTMLSHALSAEESGNTMTSNEPNMMALVLIFHLFKTCLLIKLTQVSKESTAVIIDLKYPSFSTSFQCSKELQSASEESIVLKELLQEWRVSKNKVSTI